MHKSLLRITVLTGYLRPAYFNTYERKSASPLSFVALDRLLRQYGVERGFLARHVRQAAPLDLAGLLSVYGLKVETAESDDAVSVTISPEDGAAPEATGAFAALLSR